MFLPLSFGSGGSVRGTVQVRERENTMQYAIIEAPMGFVTVQVDSDGALRGLTMHAEPTHLEGEEGGPATRDVVRQLEEYFAGQRQEFELDLALVGTEFQRRVWAAMRGIGYGRTVTYGEIAAQIGMPTASRAVGAAIGRNPVSIVVPCHRVVGSSGKLTGYSGGLERKQWLLDHERARIGAAAPA